VSEAADVIVIGAGAGGGACAWTLATLGVRVLLLESGPQFDFARDYRLAEGNWEQSVFPEKPGSQFAYTFAEMQELDPRHRSLASWNHKLGPAVSGDRRRGIAYSHVCGVGGSTLHFSGEAHRLHPAAMRLRKSFGVGADWPLDYAELEPFYGRAERLVGVAGPAVDTKRWRSEPLPLPPHPHSYASQRIGAACARLGMRWEPNTLAILSQPYAGRPGCNYCGNCARGCPRADKGSVDVTFIAAARATGRCDVRPGAHVTGIESGAGDRVGGVTWVDASGATQSAQARVVVVAGGAVHTPRLLLLSSSAQSPQGLGNESGLVGRHFMETLAWTSSALHPEPLGSHRGLPSDGICWDFNAPDAIPGVPGGCRFSLGVAEADFLGPINYARRVVPGWGRAHRAAMRTTFGRVLSVGAIGEFLPNDGSFVDLDPSRRDRHGQALARIRSRLDAADVARLEFMAGRCRALLDAAGAGNPFEESGSWDSFNASHVFGTCRMGVDPSASVVDPHCRSHRWRNLFIVDASVFPSSGGGESPSLTIEALAIRAGEHIRGVLARREA
jgi:choline dehydrogenase-like flavoprotein